MKNSNNRNSQLYDVLCPKAGAACPKAEAVCPKGELVCPREGVLDWNKGDD